MAVKRGGTDVHQSAFALRWRRRHEHAPELRPSGDRHEPDLCLAEPGEHRSPRRARRGPVRPIAITDAGDDRDCDQDDERDDPDDRCRPPHIWPIPPTSCWTAVGRWTGAVGRSDRRRSPAIGPVLRMSAHVGRGYWCAGRWTGLVSPLMPGSRTDRALQRLRQRGDSSRPDRGTGQCARRWRTR